MDIAACSAVSLMEAVVLVPANEILKGASVKLFCSLFVFQYLALKLYNTVIYPYYRSPLRHLPGPKNNTPFIGQIYHLYKGNGPLFVQLEWMRQWPDAPLIRYLSFGNSEVLLINGLKAHREILTKTYSLVKPAFFRRLIGEIVGVGLLFAEGDEHKKQRRLLLAPFSFANIKKITPIFQTKAKELATNIQDAALDSPSGIIEVAAPFAKATLDIIGVTALGLRADDPKSTESFHRCYQKMFEQSASGAIISVINMYIPLRSWLPLRANRQFVDAKNELRQLVRTLINERKAEFATMKDSSNDMSDRTDLLSFMIKEKSDEWSVEDIMGHLLNFVGAGHESTATTLTWAVHAMSIYPSVQDKLRKEIMTALSQGDDLDYNQIESLPYLNNFTREVLRLYSPTVQMPYETAVPITVQGTLIPKGTAIMLIPSVAAFNPRTWGPTAEEFDPDRWDHRSGDALDPNAFQAFTNGARMCIGKSFALLEIKILTINLVSRFRFEPSGEPVIPVASLVLKPKGGLKVKVSVLAVH